ncbi:MAG: ATP-binding cassette domain-containing protein [Tunicatimonas sp.]
MITVTSVSKVYGEQAVVSDVSFTVARGETLVLLGTSGSGKTTVLKMINRLVEPSQGSIYIDGEDIRQGRPELLRRKIGYVIQQSGLFPHYTVHENIALVPSLLGWPGEKIRQRVHSLLEVVGLSAAYAERYPHQLSGGQQQRVGIGRALAADPPLVLMDEPFGALDPITKQQMAREFAELGTLREKTVVMVTHDVLEAFALGDQICLLDGGVVQQLGTPRELLFQPKSDFVRSFFRAQRLRLAMEVLTLGDLITESAVALPENLSEIDLVSIPKTVTVFQALEKMEEAQTPWVSVSGFGAEVVTGREQLLQQFFAYQNYTG